MSATETKPPFVHADPHGYVNCPYCGSDIIKKQTKTNQQKKKQPK